MGYFNSLSILVPESFSIEISCKRPQKISINQTFISVELAKLNLSFCGIFFLMHWHLKKPKYQKGKGKGKVFGKIGKVLLLKLAKIRIGRWNKLTKNS